MERSKMETTTVCYHELREAKWNKDTQLPRMVRSEMEMSKVSYHEWKSKMEINTVSYHVWREAKRR